MARSKTARAVSWVKTAPDKRSDAEAARKFGLKSAASLTHYRSGKNIDRAGNPKVIQR